MLVLEHDSAPLVTASPFSGWKRSTWILWLCLSFLLNVDKGIFPLALRDRDFVSMAWQSSIPYALGAAAALCMAGAMFQARSAKSVIAGSLLVDAFAFCLLWTNPHPRVVSQLRACNGFVAVVVLLYIPLWVEEFSPPSSQSKWMIIFAFIGPAFGVLTGFLTSCVQQEAQSLLILAFCLALCSLKVMLSSAVTLHVPTLEKQCFNIPRLDSWSSHAVQIRQWWDEEPHTSKTVSILLGLAHAAGAPLLFFAPKVFGSDLLTCSVIALCPFIGTPIGAYLCKSNGGYRPGHAHQALKTLWGILAIGLLCTVCLFASTYVKILQPIALGCLLLSLGATLPPAAGVLMTGCPSYHRPASCFLSSFLYQIFGYAVATGVFPLVASFFSDTQGESAIVAQVFVTLMAAVTLGAYCYARFPKVVLPLGLSGIDIQKEEIECEVSRKRLIVSL